MNRLSYRPISLDDFESYGEFLADPDCVIHLIHPENAASIAVAKKLGAEHELDTEILGGQVSVYASIRSK